MKKLIIALTALSFFLSLTTLQSFGQLKIGWIKSDELLAAMPERDSATKKLEKQRDEILRTLEGMQVELNNKQETYLKQRDSLSAFIRQAKEAELYEINQKMQNFQQAGDQELSRKQQELLQPILDKAQKAIRAVAEENKYTYILDVSMGAVLYYPEDESYNVLKLVKAKLGLK